VISLYNIRPLNKVILNHMQLSTNHITYTSCADIAEIAKLLKQLGIIDFDYMRSYQNGERIYLGNNAKYFDIYFQGKHYLSGNTEYRPDLYKEQAILWSTLPNQKNLDECDRSRNIDHGIVLFQPQHNYTECFSFATYTGNDRIINTYLSNMDVLISFKEYFREKAAHIIKQAETQKITLPFNEKSDFSKYFINYDSCNVFISNNKLLTLTKRQLECCYLLMQGKTTKEIAITIGLSRRTVEDYLNHIRSKLGCNNKTELIIKLTTII
jgi:LuxR family quorum-sensing system transcriptional regulator SolR